MTEQPGAKTARRWVPVDQLLSAIEDRRIIEFPPRPRPVHPTDDQECFRVNPPEDCSGSFTAAGLHGLTHRKPSGT